MLKSVCVFCGSSFGKQPAYAEAAKSLGGALAERQIHLIYGGSRLGLMGVLADACLEHGGNVTGVMPQHLIDLEIGHNGLTDLRIVKSMHERKAMMSDLADAFIALPGGFGTFEEFFEVLTWSQLGLQRKACGLLNVSGYYDALLSFVEHGVQEAFIRHEYREMIISDTEALRLLDRLSAYEIPVVDKWIGKAER